MEAEERSFLQGPSVVQSGVLGSPYKGLQLSLKCPNFLQFIVQLKGYVRVAKASGKTLFPSTYPLETLGSLRRSCVRPLLRRHW